MAIVSSNIRNDENMLIRGRWVLLKQQDDLLYGVVLAPRDFIRQDLLHYLLPNQFFQKGRSSCCFVSVGMKLW
jgi:hypothetical protein